MAAWGMPWSFRRSEASPRTVLLPDPMEPVMISNSSAPGMGGSIQFRLLMVAVQSARFSLSAIHSLPAHLLALVLLVEPFLEGRKVVEDGGSVHLALPADGFEGLRPGAALAHGEHFVEAIAGGLVLVDRTAMQGAFLPGSFAEGAMELELENPRQEVTNVGDVAGHVILGARIEIGFAAFHRRRHALIPGLQLPPHLVVLLGRDLSGEDFPAPLIDEKSEGQEGDFIQGHLEQISDVGALRRDLVEQADLFQIFGRDGEGDGIANGLMESVVGAVLKQRGLIAVGALVVVVTQL